MKKLLGTVGLLACLSSVGQAQVTLTFEGLANGAGVDGYYTTGGGGPNFGALFDDNAVALTSGAPNCDPINGSFFAGQPSGCNAIVFAGGSSTVLSVAGGFVGSVSVYYTSIAAPGSLSVYSSIDGSGGSLASTVLAMTPSGGSGCFDLPFCPFVKATVNFAGTAKSIRFGGEEVGIAFDDVTFTPPGTTTTPEPATYALMGFGLGIVGIASRRRRTS